jgi:NAD(P)-dependent dehydrogenase (short-subunit alcohol dehydrogenase family)
MKWALVTGGAQRLGRAVALQLADAGWAVIVQYRASRDAARETCDAIAAKGVQSAMVEAEFDDSGAPERLIEQARAASLDRLRALVNCAAIFEHDDAGAIDAKLFERHMRVNALAPALLSTAFARTVEEGERGAIVNFLDFKLASPYPDHFSYSLSKYALAGATDMLARALAPRVRVNAVAPGYVLPAPGQSAERYAALHEQTPLARGATPEDVAGAVRFLLEAEAVTGQTIYVDAGLRFRSHERDFTFR